MDADRAAALGAFVRCHHEALLRFFTLRTGSREDARDLVQSAYLRILAADHPEPIRDLEGYVWRSALNLATDWGRRSQVREHYARCAMRDPAEPVHSDERDLETHERIEMAARAYEQLPPKCREAFELRVLEGEPFKEVGRAMGISDRMAKIYVARARASIRDRVERGERWGDRVVQRSLAVHSDDVVGPRACNDRGRWEPRESPSTVRVSVGRSE